MTTLEVLTLPEYQPQRIPTSMFSREDGVRLWQTYGSQVVVEFPSPKTDGQWQLTNQGWAGYLPLTEELGLELVPKVPIRNVFQMLAWAYDLEEIRVVEELVGLEAVEDIYDHLALMLAQRVLRRARQGLHRDYLERTDRLPYVRGRIDVRAAIQQSWRIEVPSTWREHTVDIPDNQLLLWTLDRIARSGRSHERALGQVRRAYRALQGSVSLHPFRAADCGGRLYSRLNEDYRLLHALCRFFLEYTGPTHHRGERAMLPFLVDMAPLFERFVAAWLGAHLPPELRLRVQEHITVDGVQPSFRIDLSIEDRHTGRTLQVLDTKYKAAGKVVAADVAQVVTYAELKGAPGATLVYPTPLEVPLDVEIGGIQVRSGIVDLADDLDETDHQWLSQLLRDRLPALVGPPGPTAALPMPQ